MGFRINGQRMKISKRLKDILIQLKLRMNC